MSCKEKGTAIILVGVLIFMFFAMAVDKNQIMLIPCAIGWLEKCSAYAASRIN